MDGNIAEKVRRSLADDGDFRPLVESLRSKNPRVIVESSRAIGTCALDGKFLLHFSRVFLHLLVVWDWKINRLYLHIRLFLR